jgi:citrate lyase subunit beta / citryl-CoA lyase
VTVINDVFTPSAEEVRRAQKIVDAFAASESSGSAAIQLDGQFIDYPIVYQAQRVLAVFQKAKGSR